MKRITSPSQAHSYISTLVENDSTRARKRRLVDGMIDGNPPFNPKTLKKTGQSHRCNVNFREGEGIINARNTSFFQLFLDGRVIVECRLRDGFQYQGRARFWESIIMEEMRDLLSEKWKGFEFEMMRLATSMNKHGDAFPLWESHDQWQFKTFITGEVLFPKNTKASVDYIRSAGVMGEIQIPDLIKYMKDEETTAAATAQGWQIDNCKSIIKRILKKKLSSHEDHWETLQSHIEQDALGYEDGMAPPVKVAHVITREDSGKYSHYIIERGRKDEGFIYKNEGAYDEITDLFVPFIASVGNGYFHGIKGIGHRVYPSVVINNRLINRTIDGAMDSQSLIISFKDGTNRRGKTLRLGNTIMLPPGAELQQHHIEKNLQAATGVYSLLTSINQSSIGANRPGLATVGKNEVAKQSARAESNDQIEEVSLEATDIALYNSQTDMLYAQMCKRLWRSPDQLAKDFRERCKKRGVPDQLMAESDLWRFTAPRSIGSGSKVMRHMNTQEILSVAPYLPEHGKRAVIEDFIEARGGPAAVNRYYPPFEDERMPTRSHQMAQIENTIMTNGQGMIVSIDDWHVTHLDSHFPFIEQSIQNAMQQPDQQTITKAMVSSQMFLDHIGKHLSFLQGDNLHASQYQEMQQRLKALIPMVRKIEQAFKTMQAQQKAQQEEQQKKQQELVDRGDQTELQKHYMDVMADVQMRQYKEDQNNQVRQTKMIHSLQMAEAETQAYIDRENRKAAASN